jgi:ribosome assembly protein YihI (activator of Der GTPase)
MAKSKKSRKVGKIGVSKLDASKSPKTSKKSQPHTSAKSRKASGNKSGTRQQLAEATQHKSKNQKQDSKIGSKKPIDINKYRNDNTQVTKTNETAPTKPKYKTPQDELDAIENNETLAQLLEKQQSQALSSSDLAYVEKLTARHYELCEMLGIDTSESDENETEVDPFAQLDAIKLDDFKD